MEGIIAAKNKMLEDAYDNRDFETIGQCYSVDCRLMPPGVPTVNGRKNTEAFWKASISDRDNSLKMHTLHIIGPLTNDSGTTAIEDGMAMFYDKSGHLSDTVKYVDVWVKTGDDWFRFIDIWNSNTPSKKKSRFRAALQRLRNTIKRAFHS